MVLKNIRHEKFALALFQGMSQTKAALKAGYAPKWIRSAASHLSTNFNIIKRIEELGQVAESMAVMSVQERQERLSEIARARLSDFIEVGEDGAIKKIDIKTGHSAALQEVVVTEFTGGKDQRARERSTKVKLHDPVRSIAELNKMDHIYEERVPAGTTIVNTFVFVLPGGKRVSPKQLREVNPIEGQAIEPQDEE